MFKENIKSLVIIVLCLILTTGIVMAYTGDAKIVVEGDMHYSDDGEQIFKGITAGKEYFQEGLVDGGNTFAYTTAVQYAASTTLTAANICDSKYITVTATHADVDGFSVTLPTAAKLISYCLYTVGDTITLKYANLTTTAATTTTIVAGTGIDLLEHDGGDVIIPGSEDATFEFMKVSDTAVKAYITSMREAD